VGIIPSTCNRGLGLTVSAFRDFATSQSRDLATSPVEPSSFHPPSPRVSEMHGPTLCSATRPLESWILTSRLDVHTSLASRHFAARESSMPPVFHSRSTMAHTAPAVGISLSRNLAIPVPKFSNLFLRGPETRSLAQIQWSSYVTDPTTILLSLPRDLATWSTQMLDSKPASSRACEIHRSLATCPPQMDDYDLLAPSSPRVLAPHDFAHPILGSLPCELPSS
jgi:hypothetical protein